MQKAVSNINSDALPQVMAIFENFHFDFNITFDLTFNRSGSTWVSIPFPTDSNFKLIMKWITNQPIESCTNKNCAAQQFQRWIESNLLFIVSLCSPWIRIKYSRWTSLVFFNQFGYLYCRKTQPATDICRRFISCYVVSCRVASSRRRERMVQNFTKFSAY